jgi:hypothetical protein
VSEPLLEVGEALLGRNFRARLPYTGVVHSVYLRKWLAVGRVPGCGCTCGAISL